ncbi:hypothetical protein GOP47_0020619 [Adiantum capillus-veneris]|uniref:PP2A regulatory subunit TAP46 n=1 Tax=Adiantum capillus-veneris TaxID=13818 RepID=A0A9D4U9G3_ADICA|nr:hypothetical protein GOP47_0020619 [Adiantum capillus-veneris]
MDESAAKSSTLRLRQEQQLEQMSLPALFDRALQLHSRSLDPQITQDEAREGYELLQRCESLIDKLALFSSNEQKDDVTTGDLKYLLVPYFKAEFLERAGSSDRLQGIKSASIYLKMFISSCERLDLVPDAEMSAFNQEAPMTAERRRATKIARFKRVKAAESKLQDIKERRERRGRSRGAAAKGSVTDHGEDHTEDEFEEEEREAWLAQIALSLCKALDLLEMLKLEAELLANEQDTPTRATLEERASKAEAWHKDAASRARTAKPPQPITCATFAQDVIEGRASIGQGHDHRHQPLFGPASLVGDISTERQRMAAQVFQPSHRLPTMSIEEAGLTEMKIMKEWTERNAKLQEEANSSWARETKKDNESDDEAAEYKARAWDDWKDENPKGSGNKKLTPCG